MLFPASRRAASPTLHGLSAEFGYAGSATRFISPTDPEARNRPGALKVLRPERLPPSSAASGFAARSASRHSCQRPAHPDTSIRIGEADGLLYYVMPLRRGRELRRTAGAAKASWPPTKRSALNRGDRPRPRLGTSAHHPMEMSCPPGRCPWWIQYVIRWMTRCAERQGRGRSRVGNADASSRASWPSRSCRWQGGSRPRRTASRNRGTPSALPESMSVRMCGCWSCAVRRIFAKEPSRRGRRQARGEAPFERDREVEIRVVGEINVCHPAWPTLALDRVTVRALLEAGNSIVHRRGLLA